MSMKVDLRVGEALRLDGGRIVVTLLEKSGQRARISVEADDSVKIQLPRSAQACGLDDARGAEMLAGTI